MFWSSRRAKDDTAARADQEVALPIFDSADLIIPDCADYDLRSNSGRSSNRGCNTPPLLTSHSPTLFSKRGKPNNPEFHKASWVTGVAKAQSYRDVVETRADPVGTLLFLYFIACAIYYFYVRATRTLDTSTPGYARFIFAIEVICSTGTFSYAICLINHTVSRGTQGLPPASKKLVVDSSTEPLFHVRVLIPCYKEGTDLVEATVRGALEADLPERTQRTVYLCDDGGDTVKKQMIDQLAARGESVKYVSRQRFTGHKDVNGKSANLNYCLQKVIYKDHVVPDERFGTLRYSIPAHEVIVIFDADMVAEKNFFLKILEIMIDRYIALCLTPQAFNNVPEADIFNNANVTFWQYMLPGLDSFGYIACTGTNFCIRADALADCGWFPTWSITEDYTLGMELKKRGYKGVYLPEYLAVGEAPSEIRNIFRQRSRWCKGQMQILFSKHCPLFQTGMSFDMRLFYTSATWCYITDFLAVPFFVVIPLLSVAGYFPIQLTTEFATAAALFYTANLGCILYSRNFQQDFYHIWFSMISNHLLWFTYLKATMNVLLTVLGRKGMGFKATQKQETDEPEKECCVPKNLGDREGTLDCYVVPLFPTIVSIVTLVLASMQINTCRTSKHSDPEDTMKCWYTSLSLVWAVYNMIPPFLFFVYIFNNGRLLKYVCVVCGVLNLLMVLVALGTVVGASRSR